MSDAFWAGVVGAVAGFVGGLLASGAAVFQSKRAIPSYRRNRIKVDLEIYEKAKALGLDVTEAKNYLDLYLKEFYREWQKKTKKEYKLNS